MFTYLITNRATSPLIKTPSSTLWWRRRTALLADDRRDNINSDHLTDQSGLTLGLQIQVLQRREEPAAV
jgi:hypothetical protein